MPAGPADTAGQPKASKGVTAAGKVGEKSSTITASHNNPSWLPKEKSDYPRDN